MNRHTYRIFAALLAIFTVFSLSACTGEQRAIATDPAGSVQPTEKTDAPASNDAAAAEAVIEEQQCFDFKGLTVTAKELKKDSIWGDGIRFEIANNADKDYAVSTRAVIVNNCMVGAFWSSTVAAGKKANETMWLSTSDLEAAGIDNIGQVEIYFYVYDTETYQTVYEAECVTIKTSLYAQMDTTVDNAGKTLYEEGGIRIVGKYVDENTFWGSSVLLLIENNSGRNISVSCEDMSINGYMVTGIFSASVYDGKYAFDTISVLSSDLEENGIESIRDIELKFHIYDCDTYETIANTDAVSFTVE